MRERVYSQWSEASHPKGRAPEINLGISAAAAAAERYCEKEASVSLSVLRRASTAEWSVEWPRDSKSRESFHCPSIGGPI